MSHKPPARSRRREASGRHSDPLTLDVVGTSVRVTGLEGASRRRFAALIGGFLVDEPVARCDTLALHMGYRAEDDQWVTSCNGVEVSAFSDVGVALTQLEWQAIAGGLDANASFAVFHAAALTRAATTLIIVAPSGSGKTTVSLELLRRGWRPYGDDITVLDVDSLALQTFPRCFHTDTPAVQARVAAPWAEPIAGVPGYSRPGHWAQSGKVPSVVIQMARETAQPSALTPLTRAEAAGSLLAAAVRNQLARRAVAEAAVRVAACVDACYTLNNNDLDDTLALLDVL